MGAYMSHKQQVWWAKVRRKGMLRFVFLYGVVGWGVLSTAGFMASWWLSSESSARVFFSQPLVFVLTVVAGGLVGGFLGWHFNEIQYKQALEDQANEQ
jgi:hypothetical protein